MSSAACESPIMSALFRRYLGKHGDENGWPRDTRTPAEILHDEETAVVRHVAAKQKKWETKNSKKINFQLHLKQWKKDFHS